MDAHRALHHINIHGIEGKVIFRDSPNYSNFLKKRIDGNKNPMFRLNEQG